jgi:TolA-binding protein
MAMALSGHAQESKIHTHHQRQYQEALSLYHHKQYQAAQTIFSRVKHQASDMETRANSAYYEANAAVRLNQIGADRLMEDFVENYPTSTKRNSAFLDVADYYFENGKYPYAMKWYGKADPSTLSGKDRERYNFNMGYSMYAAGKTKEAETYMNRVSTSDTYGSQAKYYLGFIAYQQDDYATANQRFDQINDQELLDEKLSYYQADMNFKQGNFEEAIALARQQLKKADRQEASELNKIIGESYFNMGQYATAIPYLEAYKGKQGKWSNTDYYLLGYSYYQQGDYANAIQQFNKIIGGDNNVSQNAYYHLAECYLKLDKKQEALNAFRNASQMDFSPEIQQDAYLNYARLSYEIGNAYEAVPEVLTTYMQRYPNSEQRQEIQELLVDSYITSRNFSGALALLEANRDYASAETYQKVAYFRALELFQEANYAEALELFKKSLSNPANGTYEAMARYWKAEAAYMLNRYEEALTDFVAFQQHSSAKTTTEYKDLDYHLGYTYFKLKDYTNAAAYFQNFTEKNSSGEMLIDSYARLGDSYFVSSKYWPAMEAYNKVISMGGPEKDYAAFQKALCYGFIDRESSKIEELSGFVSRYPNSTLKDDALFELGNTYIQANQQARGLEAYDRLIREYSGSSLVPRALLRQGLVHYNAGSNEQALAKFKTVVRDHENTQEAIQAVATAKLIYVDLGRVNEYAQWVEGLDFVEVTDAELDNASYESAAKQQLEGKPEAAMRGFENYLQQFPNGLHSLQGHFNLAQLYFTRGEKDKALPHYKQVTDKGSNEFSEQALARICEIYIGMNDYGTALPYLQRLENSAEISQNRTFARSNLMKGYYEQKEYAKTLEYAEQVLTSPGVDARIKSDAHIMIARSAMQTGNEARAMEAYAQVRTMAAGEAAAEAWYYDAYFKHTASQWEASNASVQKLARDYASYKEWGGKGLILMARNFYQLKDAYQATYILESVITNFSQYPAIVSEAREELARIKASEARSNSSIETGTN